jgi:hypothetical protein
MLKYYTQGFRIGLVNVERNTDEKMVVTFGYMNVRILQKSASLKTVTRRKGFSKIEWKEYKVKREKGCTEPPENIPPYSLSKGFLHCHARFMVHPRLLTYPVLYYSIFFPLMTYVFPDRSHLETQRTLAELRHSFFSMVVASEWSTQLNSSTFTALSVLR